VAAALRVRLDQLSEPNGGLCCWRGTTWQDGEHFAKLSSDGRDDLLEAVFVGVEVEWPRGADVLLHEVPEQCLNIFVSLDHSGGNVVDMETHRKLGQVTARGANHGIIRARVDAAQGCSAISELAVQVAGHYLIDVGANLCGVVVAGLLLVCHVRDIGTLHTATAYETKNTWTEDRKSADQQRVKERKTPHRKELASN
jgi:hypothetical protein